MPVKRNRSKAIAALLLLAFGVPLVSAVETADQCVECHKDPKLRVQNKVLYRYYNDWLESTHKKAGVVCSDCHGGDPAATDKMVAHDGGFMPSNPRSRVHFKNLPSTCGRCHQDVLQQFRKSKHYAALQSDVLAPHCATCHGSINSKIYYASIVESTCHTCHNPERPELKDIAAKAEAILQRLNIAKAYMGWTAYYYETQNWPGKMDEYSHRFQRIADAWHQFRLEETDRDSKELLASLKSVFEKAWAEMQARKAFPPPPEMTH